MSNLIKELVAGVKSMTLANVLVVALLILIGAPAYFVYKVVSSDRIEYFLPDDNLNQYGGCITNQVYSRGAYRYYVLYVYAGDEVLEYTISVNRVDKAFTPTEARQLCTVIRESANVLHDRATSSDPLL